MGQKLTYVQARIYMSSNRKLTHRHWEFINKWPTQVTQQGSAKSLNPAYALSFRSALSFIYNHEQIEKEAPDI